MDVGYHAGIELVNDDFFAIMGRPWDMSGAHTIGQNSWSLGLCFVGNYDVEEPDEDMIAEGVKIVKLWRKLYEIPRSEIRRHSEFANKTCPGTRFPFSEFILMC